MSRTFVVSTVLLVGLSWAADCRAVNASGARTGVVAFSLDGLALVRHVAVQHGVLRYEVLRLPDGGPIEIHVMAPEDDPEVVERALRQKHGLVAYGYQGPVAPDRSAAVLVVPGARRRTGAFEYTVQLTDGDGPRAVALVPVQQGCVAPREAAHSRIRARWAPDGRTLLLVGSVLVEPECGVAREEPVLVVVKREVPAVAGMLESLAATVTEDVVRLAAAGDPETTALAVQVLAIAPDNADLLVLLARLRTARGLLGEAVATLWALAQVPGERATLKEAMSAAWARPLRRRAAFVALQWEVRPSVRLRGPALETERRRRATDTGAIE